MSEENVSPVIAVARKSGRNEEVTLSTGVRARIKAVASALLDEAANGVPSPAVPSIEDLPDHPGRWIENPNDPEYHKAVEEYERRRSQTVIDAIVMFGVELIDPIPPQTEWLPQLKFLAKRGVLKLEGYDLQDPMEAEFVYKRYIAVGTEDVGNIIGSTTISPEAVAKAENNFQRP